MAQDPYRYFRPEARELLEQFSRSVLDLEKGRSGTAAVQRLLRLAHTLKGAARVVKQTEIANRAHAIEDVLSPLRESAEEVDRHRIDAVLGHLDAIDSHLAGLAPAAAPPAGPAAKIPADEAARTIRAEIAEADAVLDGIVETHAVLNGLRTTIETVQQAARLADLMASQLPASAAAARDRQDDSRFGPRHALAQELRRKIAAADRALGSTVDQMDRELRQLREAAERLRLTPVGGLFTTLERMARDTARAQSKQVTFIGSGGELRLDTHVIDTIQGALIQLVRNAVAHGIESEAERVNAGKPAAGRVSIAVARRERRVVLTCTDDGHGVDLDAVRRIAAQRGLIGTGAKESSGDELVGVLLKGGISTSKIVTEESGRGVGLDVVREAVAQLGGEVTCRSRAGAGATFEIVIPPSLSAMDALFVEAVEGFDAVAIPLDCVRATRRLAAGELAMSATGASVPYDGKAIPFLPLIAALDGTTRSGGRNWAAVIVAGASGIAAFGVERLLGTAKIVVRPLPQPVTAGAVVAAASLDADGNPQLVLDADGLVAAARRGCAAENHAPPAKRPVLVVDDSLTTRMLEQSILESAGYDVDVACSGEEALSRIRARRYALILVDVEMPGMDGFTFIERIRADPKSCDIPAVLVTSLAEAEHRRRGRKIGAQGYIVKSEFDQAELLSMIEPMMAA